MVCDRLEPLSISCRGHLAVPAARVGHGGLDALACGGFKLEKVQGRHDGQARFFSYTRYFL